MNFCLLSAMAADRLANGDSQVIEEMSRKVRSRSAMRVEKEMKDGKTKRSLTLQRLQAVIGSKLGEVLGIARGYGFKFDVRQACTRKLFFLLVEYCLLDGLLLDQSRCSAECRMHQESATKHASIIKMYK